MFRKRDAQIYSWTSLLRSLEGLPFRETPSHGLFQCSWRLVILTRYCWKQGYLWKLSFSLDKIDLRCKKICDKQQPILPSFCQTVLFRTRNEMLPFECTRCWKIDGILLWWLFAPQRIFQRYEWYSSDLQRTPWNWSANSNRQKIDESVLGDSWEKENEVVSWGDTKVQILVWGRF